MTMTFPPIPLSSLRPETRDWLLAQSAAEGKDPLEVMRETIDARAARLGFGPTIENTGGGGGADRILEAASN
jgi:hypothetical protein